MAGVVWAPYCGVAPVPSDWLGQWNGDPVLIGALAVGSVAGWRHAADRAAFVAMVAVVWLLLVSPLCALTSALFSARVAHHVALVGIAAPLVARAFDVRLGGLAWAALASTAIFYLWHVPAVYAAALASDAIYWAMQLTLFVSAVAFWAAVRRAPAPSAVAALLVVMVAMGLLGALLTFASAPLYAPHRAATLAWGLTPLEDQQAAGLIMWAPAAGLYLAAALAVGWRAIGPRDGLAAA